MDDVASNYSGPDKNILFLTVFCGDHDEEVCVPRQASSKEVASIIRKSLGIRGSFFLVVKTEGRKIIRSRYIPSVYFHCSSIKASVLERYEGFTWEIRGLRYQKGGDSLWYYQSQHLRPEVKEELDQNEWEPLDFPP